MRREEMFETLTAETFIVKEKSVIIPGTTAEVLEIDFSRLKISKQDWALASLAVIAKNKKAINIEMLQLALQSRFSEKVYLRSMDIVEKILQ